jgi:hypothetical protein
MIVERNEPEPPCDWSLHAKYVWPRNVKNEPWRSFVPPPLSNGVPTSASASITEPE